MILVQTKAMTPKMQMGCKFSPSQHNIKKSGQILKHRRGVSSITSLFTLLKTAKY
jgi:hypothetical protein